MCRERVGVGVRVWCAERGVGVGVRVWCAERGLG